MKNILKNRQFVKFMPIYITVLVIIVLLGTSYSLLKSNYQGENTFVMNVGVLEVSFVDSETNALTLTNMYPMTDKEGLSQNDNLSFVIKNTGDYKTYYNVYIEETSSSMMKPVIRYSASKNKEGYNILKTLADDNYIASENVLDIGASDTYNVKFWLNSNADNNYMNKTFSARIVVEAYQYS